MILGSKGLMDGERCTTGEAWHATAQTSMGRWHAIVWGDDLVEERDRDVAVAPSGENQDVGVLAEVDLAMAGDASRAVADGNIWHGRWRSCPTMVV